MKLFITVLAFFLCACSTKVTMYHTAPPKSGAPKVHRVTVMPFKGDQGSYITNSLIKMLPQLKYEDVQAYQVMDRENLRSIIAEQEFQMTIADPDTMIEFGMLAGIEGGFTGDVDYNVRTSYFQEERSERVDNKTRRYYVNCTQTDYSLRLGIKLTDYRASSVLYSNSFFNTTTYKNCPDQYSSGGGDYYARTADRFLDEIGKDLGEYPVSTVTKVAEKDKTIEDKTDEKAFKGAADAIDKGSPDRACSTWSSLAVKYPNAPYLTYNLGVCREIDGDFEGALDYYNRADSLLAEPDKMVNEAISRVKTNQARGIR